MPPFLWVCPCRVAAHAEECRAAFLSMCDNSALADPQKGEHGITAYGIAAYHKGSFMISLPLSRVGTYRARRFNTSNIFQPSAPLPVLGSVLQYLRVGETCYLGFKGRLFVSVLQYFTDCHGYADAKPNRPRRKMLSRPGPSKQAHGEASQSYGPL